MSSNTCVTCNLCGKDMVPRIVTGPPTIRSTNWTPIPRYSICPFCGGTHERFSEANFKASVITPVAFIVTLGVVYPPLNR